MAGKSVLEKIRVEDEKIAQAKAKRDKVIEKERLRIGVLAEKAGLFDVDISDTEMLKVFKEIAARFRNAEKPAAKTASQNPAT